MENYIGLNIKYLCSEKKITQKQFSEMIGHKQSTVGGYVSGRTEPNIATLRIIKKEFDVSIDDFIDTDLQKSKYSTPPKTTSKVEEPQTRYSDDKQMVIDAQKETITTLREHISLLKDKVEMLETKAARAS